jgi:hypothetical protein
LWLVENLKVRLREYRNDVMVVHVPDFPSATVVVGALHLLNLPCLLVVVPDLL